MTIKINYPAFVGGEISDIVLGRIDQQVYFKALSRARDVYIFPQGPVKRREGMEYIANTPDNVQARLVSFSFNTEQSYLLEFSEERMRVFKDDVMVADFDGGDDADLLALTADVVNEMGFTQDADTLILTHKTMQPLKITRTSDTSWTFDKITFKNIPVFAYDGVTVTNPAATLTPSATTGEITLTASASVFTSGHVGQYVVINRGLVFITGYTSGTVVDGLVVSDLSSSTVAASGKWDLETGYENVWSVTRGWPALVTFFRGRLYLCGGARPQTTWASVVGDFFNMDQGEGDDADALEFTLDDDGVNAILNVFAGRTLQLFTSGGGFFVRSSSSKPVTPSNVVDLVEKANTTGATTVRPVVIDGATIFVEDGGAVVRDFLYNDVEQSYTSNSRSDLAEHLVNDPVDMAVRKAKKNLPFDHLYVINADGSCSVLNTKKQVEFDAWSWFSTQGKFLRVAVVNKDVYFHTERVIDGGTVRAIEKLNEDMYLDYAKRGTSVSATDSWSGFDHLANEEVYVRGDGYNLQLATVDGSGEFTSSEEVEDVEAGLFWSPSVIPLPPDVEITNKGTLTAEYRKIAWLKMLFKDSDEVVVKRGNKVYRPPWRYFGSSLLDQPPPKFSGWKRVTCDGISDQPQIEITQDAPGSFMLLSMVMGVS